MPLNYNTREKKMEKRERKKNEKHDFHISNSRVRHPHPRNYVFHFIVWRFFRWFSFSFLLFSSFSFFLRTLYDNLGFEVVSNLKIRGECGEKILFRWIFQLIIIRYRYEYVLCSKLSRARAILVLFSTNYATELGRRAKGKWWKRISWNFGKYTLGLNAR